MSGSGVGGSNNRSIQNLLCCAIVSIEPTNSHDIAYVFARPYVVRTSSDIEVNYIVLKISETQINVNLATRCHFLCLYFCVFVF